MSEKMSDKIKEIKINAYKMLFENSPVSLWVEDFSGVLAYVNELKEQGVSDFLSYFQHNPEALNTCIEKLRIKAVNNATLRLYGAESKEQLLENLHIVFQGEARELAMESVIAIAEGRKNFESAGINYRVDGKELRLRITWSIVGDSIEDHANVVVVLQDMTRLEDLRRELAERETVFRKILEESSDGLILCDTEGRIKTVNNAISNLLQISGQEALGSLIWELLESHVRKLNIITPLRTDELYYRSILQANKPSSHLMEYSFFDDKHKLHAHKISIFPIPTSEEHLFSLQIADISNAKRVQTIASIMHEISHAVNIECSMDELYAIIHKALSQVIDVTNFFIALYDSRSNIVTFPFLVDEVDNDASPVEADEEASFTAQIISERCTLLLYPEDIAQRTKDFGTVGTPCKNFLGIPLKASGNVIGAMVVQSYTQPDLYDDDDRILLESISEQIAYALQKKKADEDINVLFQAIDQAGEGILIFSAEGNIQYVNTIFERITSYRRSELLDKPFEYLPFDINSRKEMEQSWLRVRSSQPWRGMIDMYRKDGPKITLDMVVKPVIDAEGRLSSIIASCKDVTYELLKEEQQKRAQRLEAIGRLTGGIAHDFNNILSAIIGYAELAGDDMEPGSDSAENLHEVLKSATRAKEMIAQLIAFSRQEEAKTEILELVDHVRESVRFLRSYLPRSIKITERYTQEQCTVIAVPGQIHQIIINLGTNAMHALQKEGALLEIAVESVSFTSKDMKAFPELDQCKYMKITVSDNGTGIDPSILDHIFDPYFTTKGANEGTGLGLSIVHSIVQSHHGAIRIDSELGVGTTFTIHLPLYMPDNAQMPINGSEEQVVLGGSETIMVVDDEPALVSILRQGLMRLGYKVEGFTDPRKAYEQFAKYPDKTDMIITDTTMPYINGVELAEKALAIRKDIPVIICTGFTTLITLEDARKRGIRDFVMKPFKIKDIAARVREIFEEDRA